MDRWVGRPMLRVGPDRILGHHSLESQMTSPTSSTERLSARNTYEAPTVRATLLVEALECTITGRPLPDVLRPSAYVTNAAVRPFCDWVQ